MKFIKSSKDMCCDDIIQCVFDLNNLDLNVYKNLRELGEARTNVLAKKIKRERSTVYRSLQKLTSCELCTKKTKTIEKGGYYHVYKYNDSKETKEKIEQCIDKWYKQMKNTIKFLEKDK